MSIQSLLLPTQHFKMAVKALSDRTELLEQILAGSGITPDAVSKPDFAFPMESLWPVLENVRNLLGPSWFLGLPILWSVDVQSEFGMAMRFAPRLADSLAVLEEFAHVRWPIGRVSSKRNAAGQTVFFTPLVHMSPADWQMVSVLVLLNFQTTVKTIVGANADKIRYSLSGEAPAYEDAFQRLVEGDCSWGQSSMSFFVPTALLSTVSPVSASQSFANMLIVLREQAATRKLNPPVGLRVEQALSNILRGQADAGEIASSLGMSRRSLERKLSGEGSGFRQLLDNSLKSRFMAMLSDDDLTSVQIAERLGYHDGSSLQRACRRWFGQSFSVIRRNHRAK